MIELINGCIESDFSDKGRSHKVRLSEIVSVYKDVELNRKIYYICIDTSTGDTHCLVYFHATEMDRDFEQLLDILDKNQINIIRK